MCVSGKTFAVQCNSYSPVSAKDVNSMSPNMRQCGILKGGANKFTVIVNSREFMAQITEWCIIVAHA